MATRLQLVDAVTEIVMEQEGRRWRASGQGDDGWHRAGIRARSERLVDELIDRGLITVDGTRGWQGVVRAQGCGQ